MRYPRTSFVLGSILAAAIVAGLPLRAQQATFRSQVQTVAVYATVQDRQGHLVPDLTQDAFQVFDDGRRVEVRVFSNDIQPITAVVLLDMSSSMFSNFLRLRRSMLAFVDALLPADRVRIGTFGLEIALSPYLTNDKAVLTRIVSEEVWPMGSTPLWSAMRAGMASLAGESGRRVVLVITDGVNSGTDPPGWPKGSESAVRKQALDEGFMIYGIGFSAGTLGFQNLDGSVIDLGERTGGGHVLVPEKADFAAALARVADELRHQYVLGFVPAVLDGKTHKVDVRMTRPSLSARARTSYLAAGDR